MKTKRICSFVLAAAILFCIFSVPAKATETTVDTHIEIYIENQEISEETKARILEYYSVENPADDGVATCGITCTLFGHKLETSTITQITHKVRATSPRCLKKTYNYSACTRCDHETSTLLKSEYIICC